MPLTAVFMDILALAPLLSWAAWVTGGLRGAGVDVAGLETGPEEVRKLWCWLSSDGELRSIDEMLVILLAATDGAKEDA